MTDTYKKIISDSLYITCVELLNSGESFNILLDNHDNWDKPLPEQLQKESRFIVSIKEQTLEDSYVDKDQNIVINTQFGEEIYSKVLENADISALMNTDNKSAIIGKPFIEKPQQSQIKIKLNQMKEPGEEGINNSMAYFKKNNPKMFE